jgi:hypothetical protein
MAPWPGADTHAGPSSHPVIRSARPSRRSPAPARRRTSYCPLVELAEARADVAAHVGHGQVGPSGEELRPTAEGGGADAGTGGQVRERADGRRAGARDEHIARVLALEQRDRVDLGRELGGQVLERVDAQIHLAGAQRRLELGGEQPLAAELIERLVEAPVAEGVEGDRLARDAHPGERALHEPRLAHGELAASRAEAHRAVARPDRRAGRVRRSVGQASTSSPA